MLDANTLAKIETPSPSIRPVLRALEKMAEEQKPLPHSVPFVPKSPVSLSAQISHLEEELAKAQEARDSFKLSAALHEQEATSLRQQLRRATVTADHMLRKFTALKTLLEAFVHFQRGGGTILADAMSRAERDFYGESMGAGKASAAEEAKSSAVVELSDLEKQISG